MLRQVTFPDIASLVSTASGFFVIGFLLYPDVCWVVIFVEILCACVLFVGGLQRPQTCPCPFEAATFFPPGTVIAAKGQDTKAGHCVVDPAGVILCKHCQSRLPNEQIPTKSKELSQISQQIFKNLHKFRLISRVTNKNSRPSKYLEIPANIHKSWQSPKSQ